MGSGRAGGSARAKGARSDARKPATTSSFHTDNALQVARDLVDAKYADSVRGAPIHEIREHVAQKYGAHAASHEVLDPMLMRMYSEGKVELRSISDLRNATKEQLRDSIGGVNETLFYLRIRKPS